jgi:hypothetical protein
MSTIIRYNNRIYSFSEFLLSESIKPKKTPYGLNFSDFNDSEIHEGGFLATCFLHPEQEEGILVAILETGECSFGTFLLQNFNADSSVLDFIEVLSDKKKSNGSPGLKIFNSVFYVLLEIIKKFDLNKIYFNASNKDLGNAYERMVKNEYFLQELEHIGFFYRNENENHIFTKGKGT